MLGMNDNHVIRVAKYNSIKDKQGKGFKLPSNMFTNYMKKCYY
jgi:hypothetical protein